MTIKGLGEVINFVVQGQKIIRNSKMIYVSVEEWNFDTIIDWNYFKQNTVSIIFLESNMLNKNSRVNKRQFNFLCMFYLVSIIF